MAEFLGVIRKPDNNLLYKGRKRNMIPGKFKTILILISIFLSAGIVNAEDSCLEKLFSERNLEGTIVISSLDGMTEYLYNKNRSEKRFLPASTFKIPNTLIALDEGAIANEKEIIKWDGEDKGWDLWNKDQSLETAFPISCVWFYQELAKRVGNSEYLSHLDKMHYGNKMTGSDVTTFWLEGDLKISAREQIDFLKTLYNDQLPYKKEHLTILKKIMVVDETPQYVLRAKTGWTMRIKHQIGWYVGYVETSGQVWFFATNIDIKKKSDSNYRKEIAMEALQAKGIISYNK
jgi:beta-lactamase class D